MGRMTPEKEAEFWRRHPFHTMLILGAKPPKWLEEKARLAGEARENGGKPPEGKTGEDSESGQGGGT